MRHPLALTALLLVACSTPTAPGALPNDGCGIVDNACYMGFPDVPTDFGPLPDVGFDAGMDVPDVGRDVGMEATLIEHEVDVQPTDVTRHDGCPVDRDGSCLPPLDTGMDVPTDIGSDAMDVVATGDVGLTTDGPPPIDRTAR